MGAADSYYFSGINNWWLDKKFEPEYSRFPFIGARDRLAAMQKEKGLFRRVAETLLRRVKIKSLLDYVTEKLIGWKRSPSTEPNKLAEELIKVFDEETNKQTTVRFLEEIRKRCQKRGRYFETIGVYSQASLSRTQQSSLQDEMVVICGQLAHRDAIAQYNAKMAQMVAQLPGEWLLTDFPPHGLVEANERFKGKVVCLTMEKEVGQIFQKYLPFRRDLGWYPYCRVSGFFKEPGHGQGASSVELVLAEFRRPKPYQDVGPDYFEFLEKELNRPNWLKERSEFLCASYVLPLVAKGWNIENFKADSANQKTVLQQYVAQAGADLPAALAGWYANV
jgi:hypothetical protein